MRVLFLGVITILLFFAHPVFAHPFGESFEVESNGFLIDIGYNTSEFIEGESVLFQFELLEDEAMADFDSIWVRISKENKTVFAGGINNEAFGGARMTTVFPEVGEYEFSVRYQSDDGTEAIAEGVFPFSVLHNPRAEGSSSLVMPLVFGIIGLLAGALIMRAKLGA